MAATTRVDTSNPRRNEMKAKSLSECFLPHLQDPYDAENQLITALPKMTEAASSAELRNAFEEHLEQTRNQATRLEQVFEIVSDKAKKADCKGMQGLIKEGNEMIKSDSEPEVRDVALIAAAQRVEHYEIAGYGCVRTYARLLGYGDAESLLQQTLEEEKEADQKLNDIAENLNVEQHGARQSGLRQPRLA